MDAGPAAHGAAWLLRLVALVAQGLYMALSLCLAATGKCPMSALRPKSYTNREAFVAILDCALLRLARANAPSLAAHFPRRSSASGLPTCRTWRRRVPARALAGGWCWAFARRPVLTMCVGCLFSLSMCHWGVSSPPPSCPPCLRLRALRLYGCVIMGLLWSLSLTTCSMSKVIDVYSSTNKQMHLTALACPQLFVFTV
jgi:hypothetical protein